MQIRVVVCLKSMNQKDAFLNQKLGFTLIELIIYIALVSLFVTSAIFFAWDVVYGREKAYQNQVLAQNARGSLARITSEIRRATTIQSITSNQIVLDNSGSTTSIGLAAGKIVITSGGNGPYSLTSNHVEVIDLTFTSLSTSSNSENINVSISLRQAQPAVSGQFTAQKTISHTTELKGQFNMARSLLIGSTGTFLSNSNRNIEGVSLQNTGVSDIVIDQLTVSWTGVTVGVNITEVQIGGRAVEWTGSQGSGSTLNITDFTLPAGASISLVDYLQFDGDMSGATVELNFLLADGSSVKTTAIPESLISASPTPSPSPGTSPGPTPSPAASPTTCAQVCINNGYSSGTCRQNAQNCTNNGQIRLPVGDTFCTGGPNADTCCCTP